MQNSRNAVHRSLECVSGISACIFVVEGGVFTPLHPPFTAFTHPLTVKGERQSEGVRKLPLHRIKAIQGKVLHAWVNGERRFDRKEVNVMKVARAKQKLTREVVAGKLHQVNLKQHSLREGRRITKDEGLSFEDLNAPRCSECSEDLEQGLFNHYCPRCEALRG